METCFTEYSSSGTFRKKSVCNVDYLEWHIECLGLKMFYPAWFPIDILFIFQVVDVKSLVTKGTVVYLKPLNPVMRLPRRNKYW